MLLINLWFNLFNTSFVNSKKKANQNGRAVIWWDRRCSENPEDLNLQQYEIGWPGKLLSLLMHCDVSSFEALNAKQSRGIASSDPKRSRVKIWKNKTGFWYGNYLCTAERRPHTDQAGVKQRKWWLLTLVCVFVCAIVSVSNVVLTNIVVMVSVVLKSVSVTLIDGSVLSMDSPSSECHRPICNYSTHTRAHTHTN